MTGEGALVLGLSLDDPDNAPETVRVAAALMNELKAKFAAEDAVGGVEQNWRRLSRETSGWTTRWFSCAVPSADPPLDLPSGCCRGYLTGGGL